MHLGKDILGEGLLDLVDVDNTTGLSDTSGLLLDELEDVAVHRVLHQCQSDDSMWSGPSSSSKKD